MSVARTSAPIAVHKDYTPLTAERNTFLSPLQQEWEFANTYSTRIPGDYLERLRQALLGAQEKLITETEAEYKFEVATDILYIHIQVIKTEIRIKYIKLRPCAEGCQVYQLVLEWFMMLTLLQRPNPIGKTLRQRPATVTYANFERFLQEHCLETNEQILVYYGFQREVKRGEINCFVNREQCQTYNYSARFRNQSRVHIELDPLANPPKYTLDLNPAAWITADELNNFHKTQERFINKLRFDESAKARGLQASMSKRAIDAYNSKQDLAIQEAKRAFQTPPKYIPRNDANIQPFFEEEKRNVLQKLRQDYPYQDDYVLDYSLLPPNVKKVPGIENMELRGLSRFTDLKKFFQYIIHQKKEIPQDVLEGYLQRLSKDDPIEIATVAQCGYNVPPAYLKKCIHMAMIQQNNEVLKSLEGYPGANQILFDEGYRSPNLFSRPQWLQTPWLQNLRQSILGFAGFSQSQPPSAGAQSVMFTNKPS